MYTKAKLVDEAGKELPKVLCHNPGWNISGGHAVMQEE